jgi:predicted DsbA family dithiol-disulfide isomerase
MAEKFGEERSAQMAKRLHAVGKEVGIDFKSGGRTGLTRDSHRLIRLGKLKGAETQNRVVNELFIAYFENEKDITSHEDLLEAGVNAGLDREEVRNWLAGDDGGRETDAEVMDARKNFITGVPNITIQGQYEVRGAQDSEGFLRVFEKIKELEAAA